MLETRTLTQEDFLLHFGENGIYKEAQYLNLSYSFFRLEWLKLLPKTIKALKMQSLDIKQFSKYGHTDRQLAFSEMVKTLGETLPHLKFLDISSNHIGFEVASEIAKLSSLKSLFISMNQLGVTGAAEIAKLSSLSTLDISDNRLKASGAKEIAILPSLNYLDISNNRLGASGAKEIAKLASLRALDISNNNLGVSGVREIAKLVYLSSLNISDNNFEEEVIGELQEKLPSTKLTNKQLESIQDY